MGAGYFVVLERPIKGIDPSDTNGKWLCQFSEELDVAAEELGVTPLSQFFSMRADEVQQLIDFGEIAPEDLERLPDDLNEAIAGDVKAINNAFDALRQHVTDQGIPPEQWFDASKGLATLRQLRNLIRTHPKRFAMPDYLAVDLEEAERILVAAAKEGIRFHMSVDA